MAEGTIPERLMLRVASRSSKKKIPSGLNEDLARTFKGSSSMWPSALEFGRQKAPEFALSEVLRDTIAQEQDYEIDLKDALGLR